jgi:hypothetical protein
LDPIFPRSTPLPAQTTRTYTADRTLRPSDVEASLPIKFWETEVSDDGQEKWWAGCVHVRASQLKRPIQEGTAMEVTIKIDTSRKITAEVFVPLLNQAFSDEVYIPDPPTARSEAQRQLDECFDRIAHLRHEFYRSSPALRAASDTLPPVCCKSAEK